MKGYPAILGCDVAGDIVEVHPSLAGVYRIGDRVVGAAVCRCSARDGTDIIEEVAARA